MENIVIPLLTGEQIRQRRLQLNLSQAELGALWGVSGNTVARWERGESVPDAPGMLACALIGLEALSAGSSPKVRAAKARVAEMRRRLREHYANREHL